MNEVERPGLIGRTKGAAAAAMVALGVDRALDRRLGPDRLTVLCYHRVNDVAAPGFSYDPEPVSATPADFARQMDYVAARFNVIDLAMLEGYVYDGRPLPPRPALITFDDGYRDNYTHAYPILRERGLPAVIFVAVGHVDTPHLPWWDRLAYLMRRARPEEGAAVDLPMLGRRPLATAAQRREAHTLFLRWLKAAPEGEKLAALAALEAALQVTPPADPDLFLTWDQVRELVDHGIACQSHTVHHPILTRVSLEEARRRLEEETGRPVTALAYPNGLPGDYSAAVQRVLRETGYRLAFTLAPGPTPAEEARRRPLEIARVFVRHEDGMAAYALRVMGWDLLATPPAGGRYGRE
jgi:peptidoglycan/xylan/chitin deacetylase (PgdA/CDA1 family)